MSPRRKGKGRAALKGETTALSIGWKTTTISRTSRLPRPLRRRRTPMTSSETSPSSLHSPRRGPNPSRCARKRVTRMGLAISPTSKRRPLPDPLPWRRRRRRFPSRSDRRGIWPRSGGTISPQGARRRSGTRFLAARDGTSVHEGRLCTVQMERRRWMRGRRCATP